MLNSAVLDVYESFARSVDAILGGGLKALYAFGSSVYGDLHAGYSDLDFFAVVSCGITQAHHTTLCNYRKQLRSCDNKLFGMLEGEFVPESMLATREGGRVAYWGTSGERMKGRYDLAGFSMRGLLDDGILICGEEVRAAIPHPSGKEMLRQVENLIQTVRTHTATTNEDVHSADWLFLICQSLYWMKTQQMQCKTKAAEWAKGIFDEAWYNDLDHAIAIRLDPNSAAADENRRWLAGLGSSIQLACDTLVNVYRSAKVVQ